MTQTLDPDQAADNARRLLDERIDAVRLAAQGQQRCLQAQASKALADADYADLWAAALKRGWTTRELVAIGLDDPTAPTPRRRRAKRQPSRPTPPGTADADNEVGGMPFD